MQSEDSKQKRIVTLTLNPALDVSMSVDTVEPERKLRCDAPQHHPGGGGLNVSRVIHRLGGSSQALWMRGAHTGALLGKLLDDEGIEHRPIDIEQPTRENVTVLERTTERQYRFNAPGAEVPESTLDEVLATIGSLQADYLVASGSLPPKTRADWYADLARHAAERGMRFVIDTHGEPLVRAGEAGVWLMKPNLHELSILAGQEVEDDREMRSVARRLIDEGAAEVLVVSLGSGGARVFTRDLDRHVASPTVPIRSKVGAGDSMVAGMLVAHASGASIEEAVEAGVAAGAAAVMTPGSELCRREDFERLRQQMRDRG